MLFTHVRMAAAATAVAGVVLGVAQVAPDPDGADVAVMMPTGDVLHGVGPGEGLPLVPPEPEQPVEPRQVAGPVPLQGPGGEGAKAQAAPAAAPVAYVAGSRGIPGAVLAAYRQAAERMAVERPGCNLTWPLLAGIGRIESGHARNGDLDADGTTRTKIVGPALDGSGNFALIRDSDGGKWDGDTTYDRAVGPMQFLPGTWLGSGRDGNGDGDANPNNIHDATLASAHYLCFGGADLSKRDDLLGAVFRYNRSWEYVSNVLTWAGVYTSSGPLATVGTAPAGKGKEGSKSKDGGKDPVVVAGPKPRPKAPATPAPTPGPVTTPPATTPPAPVTPPPATVPPVTPSPDPVPVTSGVAGRVLDDRDRRVAGVPVTVSGPVTTTVQSDVDGTFVVAGLPPGEYVLRAGAGEGYAAPAGDGLAVTLVAGKRPAGLILRQVTAALSGRAFVDAERDSLDAGTEPGVAALTLRLSGTDVRGREVDLTTSTDAEGRFGFTGLVAGTYTIAAPAIAAPYTTLVAIAPVGEALPGGGVTVTVSAGADLAGFGFALGTAGPGG